MTFSLNQQQNRTSQTLSYLRVSQASQDLEKDKSSILALANELKLGNVTFIEEKISGKVSWKKRKISELIDVLQEGDNLIVAEISRLGRSLLEIVEILSICSRKKINVFSVKGAWKLDGTMQSKIIGTVFALCSEIERSLISQRTTEALRIKKLNGTVLGRPRGKVGKSKLDQFRLEIEGLLINGATQAFISNRYRTTPANLCLWMKKHNIRKPTI
ncbi:MAG TPA: recombinase family protein [Patescibacteria group bacterium]|nr:recombinase family protein [Patescibacteria group bacterium]